MAAGKGRAATRRIVVAVLGAIATLVIVSTTAHTASRPVADTARGDTLVDQPFGDGRGSSSLRATSATVASTSPSTWKHVGTTNPTTSTIGAAIITSAVTHHSGVPATVPATVPDTVPAPAAPPTTIGGQGTMNGGVFCGGWIHRMATSAHLLISDTTGGRAPTATDCANAHAFYSQTAAAIAKYSDINVAIADNFKPGTDAPGQIPRHYVHWGPSPTVGDPNHPEGLVYRFDAAGHATLLAAYFFETASGSLPQPGGPLTIWHAHSAGAPWMLHVWIFPGTVDPFALMFSGA